MNLPLFLRPRFGDGESRADMAAVRHTCRSRINKGRCDEGDMEKVWNSSAQPPSSDDNLPLVPNSRKGKKVSPHTRSLQMYSIQVSLTPASLQLLKPRQSPTATDLQGSKREKSSLCTSSQQQLRRRLWSWGRRFVDARVLTRNSRELSGCCLPKWGGDRRLAGGGPVIGGIRPLRLSSLLCVSSGCGALPAFHGAVAGGGPVVANSLCKVHGQMATSMDVRTETEDACLPSHNSNREPARVSSAMDGQQPSPLLLFASASSSSLQALCPLHQNHRPSVSMQTQEAVEEFSRSSCSST